MKSQRGGRDIALIFLFEYADSSHIYRFCIRYSDLLQCGRSCPHWGPSFSAHIHTSPGVHTAPGIMTNGFLSQR
jgi:hypothetical protein